MKRKPNMVAGAQGDTPEVVGWYLNMLRDTFSDTINVEHTLSCTQPHKIMATEVAELYLGAFIVLFFWGWLRA